MELFDETLRKRLFCVVDNEVDAMEMVDSFHDVIHVHYCVSDADSVRFEDIACLVVRQTATFDVIGVVGQVNLCSVVNASSELGGFLLPQRRQ